MSTASLGPLEKFTTVSNERVHGQIVAITPVAPTEPSDPLAFRVEVAPMGSETSSTYWVDQPTFTWLENARVIWEADAHQ